MPLTEKGNEIMSNMQEQYGPEKGKSVFYASKNAGTISGVDMVAPQPITGIVGNAMGAEVFGLPGAAERIASSAPNLGYAGKPSIASVPRPILAADRPLSGMDAIVAWGNNYELHAAGPDDGPKATPEIKKASSL
jgi:hypothetical protein